MNSDDFDPIIDNDEELAEDAEFGDDDLLLEDEDESFLDKGIYNLSESSEEEY